MECHDIPFDPREKDVFFSPVVRKVRSITTKATCRLESLKKLGKGERETTARASIFRIQKFPFAEKAGFFCGHARGWWRAQ
jgi:hypothetical protein